MLFYSTTLFSQDNNSTPWVVLRKENKTVQEQNKEAANDMIALFNLMNSDSRLRKICLDEVQKGGKSTYHCENIAQLLYCAQANKTRAHQAYCNDIDKSLLGSDFHANYHITKLAEEHKLTPQQTVRELELFYETMKKFSEDKK